MVNKYLCIAAVAATTLASCQISVIESPLNRNTVTELFAFDASERTTLNPDWSVSWTDGDDLTVFNAEAGSSVFSDNCRFKLTGTASDGHFVKSGDESKNLVGGASSYDWYVCSPWMQYGTNPGGTKGYTVAVSPQQVGYGNADHIASYDLMAGKALGVEEGITPVIGLHHVTTLMMFTVTNNTGEATTINGLTLDATDGGSYITGSFTMDYGAADQNPSLDPTRMGSSKSYTCALQVVKNAGTTEAPDYVANDVVVANGESVNLYMTVAPFTIASGKKIVLTIKGGLGDLVIKKTMGRDITFAAGAYNTASLSYTKPEYVVFTETFGNNTVATGNIPSYGKVGLTTLIPAHAESYTYSVTGNASFAPSYVASQKINTADYSQYVDGAVVKLPATASTSANSAVYIKGITVEPNTTYIFRYNKSKGQISGNEFDTSTTFKWRVAGASAWNTVNATTAAGTITQEFTTGTDVTSIDLGVEATDRLPAGTVTYYPALDLFQLIKK